MKTTIKHEFKLNDLTPQDTQSKTKKNAPVINVNGACLVDDNHFSKVLAFDGIDDIMTLPAEIAIRSFSVWINWNYAGGYRYLFDGRQVNNIQTEDKWELWFGSGGIGSKWSRMCVDGEEAIPSPWNIPQNKWVHLYMEASKTFGSQFAFMGSLSNLNEHMAGKLALLRLYDMPVSNDDLMEQRKSDMAVRDTYRAPLPIDFNLLDEDDNKNLYIYGDSRTNKLNVEILNKSPKNIALKSELLSQDDYHFQLEFRPGILDSGSLKNINEKNKDNSDWEVAASQGPDGRMIVKLKRKDGTSSPPYSITAESSTTIELDGFIADNHYGSRSTQVMLKYSNLLYAGDADTPLTGEQIAYLNIITRVGKEYIPLHVGFVGSNSILNDGITDNSLTLHITNIAKDYTIKFQNDGTTGDNDSMFTFDFGGANVPKDFLLTQKFSALTLEAKLVRKDKSEVELEVKNTGKDADSANISFVMPQDQLLAPGEYIQVIINNIYSKLPSGIAKIYLKYEDIEGYWDGRFALPVIKSPIAIRDVAVGGATESMMGVGTNDPKAKLDVNGDVKVTGKLTVNLGSKPSSDGVEFRHSNQSQGIGFGYNSIYATGYNDNQDLNIIPRGNGNVGIGTTNPLRRLEVDNAMRFTNNSPDKNDGVIGTAPFSAGLNIVGINTDKLGRKISTWGSFNQIENPSGNNFIGKTTFDGNVGIATTNPIKGKLEIGAYASYNFSPVGGIGPDGKIMGPQRVGNWGTAIWADGKMSAHAYFVPSDLRIKEIGEKSDSRHDLEIIKKIEITDYQMKDVIAKGNGNYKKVIAQQVRDVYPQSISFSTDVVPDIYQSAHVENGWIKLATNLNIGEKVQLIFGSDKMLFEVLETSEHKFKIATELKGDVFVYGREVNDFLSVDYEAISMLNVSATQELAKRQVALEKENQNLKKKIDAFEARFAELEARLHSSPQSVFVK